jgi:exopolysaccharide production protein ExoQ
MSLGAFCFALLALGERRYRVVRVAMFLLCCALLLVSKSATAVVVTLLMLALLPLRRLLYLSTRKLVYVAAIVFPIAAAGVFWAVEYSDEIFLSLGRDSSLTGRIPLWQLVLKEIALRPIRGYGFDAYWDSWEGHRVSDTVNWDVAVPHAHNGFLEVWLGLGLVGLAMILINLSRNFILALRTARSHREAEYSWPLLLVVFTVLYNLTEVSLLGVNSMPWMAYGAVTFWLVRAAHEEKLALEPQPEAEPAYSG